MDYDERQVIEETVFRYHSDLRTAEEHKLALAFLAKAKGSIYNAPDIEERLRATMGTLGDLKIDSVLAAGFLDFRRSLVNRILRDHSREITFNRCPECNRIVKTPQAKWCQWCKFDWH